MPNNISLNYEKMHLDIFNPIEQERLGKALKQALMHLRSDSQEKTALDYGCGTGNLTRRLIDLGFQVVAADVSADFLNALKNKLGDSRKYTAMKINGINLSEISDNFFDFSAAYSVLHHIVDYLSIVRELIRVTKPGGIIYLDHERSEASWNGCHEYREFLRQVKRHCLFNRDSLRKYLIFSNYFDNIIRLAKPHYQREGDIHVWPDDHIEWGKIEEVFAGQGCGIVLKEEYLLNRSYPQNVYDRFKDKCSDYCLMVARKG